MQLHQTPKLSPRRVVVLSSRLLFLAVLLVLAACGTAEDFSDDVAFIETDTVDLEAGADAATDPAATASADAEQTATDQPPTGQDSVDQAGERPVLEVSADPAADQADTTTSEPPADAAADPSTAPASADGSSTEAHADGSQANDDQPAAGTTDEPATPPTTAATPATDPPQTQPPVTEPAETTPPAPPVTEAPVAAPPQATTAEPNCGVSCNIAMEGDSLTVGLGNRLCGAVQTGNCINSGIVGRRVDEMIVTARTDVDNQVGAEGNDVLILWGGTNDLWQKFHSPDPATNAAAIYEQIKIFVAERRANGWDRIYVMTLPPMNPTYVVGTEPLNDLIRQNAAGADGILDVGADGRLANAFDPAMRAADGIHFGDGGRAVVMEYILGAIAELDGV